MADRQGAPDRLGDLLKDMALRQGQAFPDFRTLYAREAGRRRKERVAFGLGTSLVALGLTAALGWNLLSRPLPLIETWETRAAASETSRSSSPDPLFSYLEALWETSSAAESGAR